MKMTRLMQSPSNHPATASSSTAARRFPSLAAVALALAMILSGAPAQAALAWGKAAQEENHSTVGDGHVHIFHAQGNVYMLVEPTNNVTVQIGDKYIIVVDTGVPELSDEVIAAIRSLSSLPIMFIVNTSSDDDHIGGDAKLSQAGWALPNAGSTGLDTAVSKAIVTRVSLAPGAPIVGHKNTVNRNSDPRLVSTSVTYGQEGFQLFNNEPVLFYYMPAAHTDGDTIVFFRGSEVLSVGDLFSTVSYPVIESDKGGSIDGVINALNEIISILVPRENEEGGTYVVPGHGHLCDRNDVVNYRDMVTIIRGRIEDMVKKDMTLAQVKAAKPTFDYDRLYGASTGPWTTDMFIEAIYRDLTKEKSQQSRKEE
jgi:glyoxylase-like metal-dependent hydrolase (beta-lactamase superfamily II)